MEYTNKSLKKMDKNKRIYNSKYASWYYRMYRDIGGEIVKREVNGKKVFRPKDEMVVQTSFNRGERIHNCLNLWLWDKYEKNKLLDLQRVNRCMNNKFCPNCKILEVTRLIHEFRNIMPELLEKYDFYMLTLTVPSIHDDGTGVELKKILDLWTKKFNKLIEKYSASLLTPTGKKSKYALQNRYFVIKGGIRVLEVTYNFKSGFHPHYHILVLVPKNSIDEYLLEECEKGKYSHKKDIVKYWSKVELQIGKAWTMLWYGVDFRLWDKCDFTPSQTYLKCNGEKTEFKNLQIDFSPLDEDGIYEVFKYTFKDTDIENYKVFKSLVNGLENRRLRQPFGVLRNFKCEDFDKGETQPLELAIMEEPQTLLTTEIYQLITEYKDYKKISRFNKGDLEETINNIE